MKRIFILCVLSICAVSQAQIRINPPLCTQKQCTQQIHIRPRYIPKKSKPTQKQIAQIKANKQHKTHPQIKKQHASCFGVAKQ